MKYTAAISVGAFAMLPATVSSALPFATCKDCYCIPPEGESCPSDSIPPSTFPQTLIDNYRQFTVQQQLQLPCDPYDDVDCNTVPALEVNDGGVCVIEYAADVTATSDEKVYTLKTVGSRRDAENALQIITHEGHCGVCSTLQDLAVYMSTDLTTIGTTCGLRMFANFDDGVACFEEAGFSKPCATMWAFNTRQTATSCIVLCSAHAASGNPNNDQDTCELVPCIQCDEDNSGPKFQKFAGRTRRNSGILTKIVRPCHATAAITHRDPFDATPLTLAPAITPTLAPTASSAFSSLNAAQMALAVLNVGVIVGLFVLA